jgi:hypothetical protein
VLLALLIGVIALYLPTGRRKTVDEEASMPAPSPLEVLEPGQTVTRMVWGDIRFAFQGSSGEVITLRVTGKSPGLDTHVSLIDPEENKEAADDDSGGHGNSLIKPHVLEHSGRYTVKVELAESKRGNVEVLLKKAKGRARRQV